MRLDKGKKYPYQAINCNTIMHLFFSGIIRNFGNKNRTCTFLKLYYIHTYKKKDNARLFTNHKLKQFTFSISNYKKQTNKTNLTGE